VGLPLAQLLEDMLTVRVGPIYFSALKLTLFVGGLVMLKHCHPHVLVRSKVASPFLVAFLLFGVLQSASILYADSLQMSQRVNYMLYHTTGMIVTYGLARAMVIAGHGEFLRRLRKALSLVFYSSLVLGTAQLVLRDQILRNIGGFPDQLGNHVIGFNLERLFLCEFLNLGLASVLLERGHGSRKAIIVVWTVVIVAATKSFTGLLGLGLVAIVMSSRRLHYVAILGAVAVIFGVVLRPAFTEIVYSPAELEYLEYRYRTNIEDYQESNWRYLSSVLLVREALETPTLLGHGYKENERFLREPYEDYYYAKHGRRDKEERRLSSHTLLSVLYDQGLVGFGVFVAGVMLAGVQSARLLVLRNVDAQHRALILLSVVLAGLMVLRILFYYHSLYRWHFLVAAVFLNTAWYWSRRERRAETALQPA
jgi:hypothetical protein